MISVICIFIYMFITCYILGFSVWRVMAGKHLQEVKSIRTTAGCVYAGVVFVMVYAQFCSLFFKVARSANLLLLLLCLLCVVIWRKDFREEGKRLKNEISIGRAVSMALLFLLFAYGTSRGILHYDTGLYHAQSIRWIEEYGIVKGLGNLHTRLAYNSASFAFSALYSFAFLGGQSFHCGAGFLAFILAVTCISRFWEKQGRYIRLSDFARLTAGYYLLNIFDEMISPASDYFMVLLVFYLLIRWLELLEEEESTEKTYFGYAMLSVLGAAVVTVKLSGAVILLLVIMPALRMIQKKAWGDIGKFLAAGVITVAPFFARNVLLSGWLVYPFTAIDLFRTPYKIPKGVAEYDSREIKVWGRGYSDVTRYTDSITQWFPDWFLQLDGTNKVFFFLAIAGMVCFAVLLIFTISRRKRENGPYLLVLGTVSGCFVFWMLTSPLIRYGCIFLWLTAVLNLGMIYIRFLLPKDRGRIALLLFLVIGCYKIWNFVGENIRSFTPQYFVAQKDYEIFENIAYEIHGYTFYYPKEGDRTGYEDFPAAPQKASDSLFLGEQIKDGFASQENEAPE